MLSRCRQATRTKVSKAHPTNAGESVVFQTTSGRSAVARSEAAEARLSQQAAITKTSKDTARAAGASASRPPPAVATPFPPVRPRKKTG